MSTLSWFNIFPNSENLGHMVIHAFKLYVEALSRHSKILNINYISWNYTKSLSEPQELQSSTSWKDLCNIWLDFRNLPKLADHSWYLWRHRRDLVSKCRGCPTHIAQIQRCTYFSEIIVLLMFNRNICHINANWL